MPERKISQERSLAKLHANIFHQIPLNDNDQLSLSRFLELIVPNSNGGRLQQVREFGYLYNSFKT
jgi:hypothetical protein